MPYLTHPAAAPRNDINNRLLAALPVEEYDRVRPHLARLDLAQGQILHCSGQTADAPPLGLHRAFVGADGELRAGQIVPELDELYAELSRQTSPLGLSRVSYRIDEFVYDEAFALFLCAPQALYAVNKQVDFTPYSTTFELAECKVSDEHWSRRG